MNRRIEKEKAMMNRRMGLVLVMCIAAGLFVVQCGGDEDDKEKDSDADSSGGDTTDTGNDGTNEETTDSQEGATDDGTNSDGAEDLVTGTLLIPEDFDCTTDRLSMLFFESTDSQVMPAGFGSVVTSPVIEAGKTFDFTSSQADLEGDYYLFIVLYCDGGGAGMNPVSGVDWVGSMDASITLGPGTGTVDAGEIALIIMP